MQIQPTLTLFILKKFKLIDDFTRYEDFVFSRDQVFAGLISWKPNIFSSKFDKILLNIFMRWEAMKISRVRSHPLIIPIYG